MNIDEEGDSGRLYKILLLGDLSVGKSCILLRYCDDSFQELHLTTIGLDFRLKTVHLDINKKVKAQIWDTAGQDRFRSITKNYFKGANGILLIFDVTNRSSFEHVSTWIEQIREEASEQTVIYLVGNKIDDQNNRVVTNQEAIKLTDEFKLKYYETSAKNNINIGSTFFDLIKDVDSSYSKQGNDNNGIAIEKTKKTKKKCCKSK